MINPEDGLCGPVSLSSSQTVLFSQGNDQFFANRTSATGLGPYFVATGCGSCHSNDNRGHPFTILTRFGQSDTTGNTFLNQGGPQLGTFCLPGYTSEDIPAGAIVRGDALFNQIGCQTCHIQTLTTGYSPIDALSYQTINPFTDLLLHDMGPGLDDGYTEGNAKTSEWRTAPLWGLGLGSNVQGGYTYLLHDGRAHSIEEAIQMQGGEASASSGRFSNLSQSDKDAIVSFLKSL